jgi:predicted RNase H-like HicB family nuclease
VIYAVVFERGRSSVGAYVPDLPGCAAIGNNREEAARLIRSAIGMHLQAMRDEGESIPEPVFTVESIEV